jgi:hypothetical protein
VTSNTKEKVAYTTSKEVGGVIDATNTAARSVYKSDEVTKEVASSAINNAGSAV